MRAYRMTVWQRPPELVDVPVPEPGPGQALVRVEGSGACHSDLHVMEWPPGTLSWELPFTLGHETAGRVEAVGAGVTEVVENEAVAVYGPWGCGHCSRCRRGLENYCERASEMGAAGGGLGRDGGMAEYLLVPSPRLLVPLGDLDPVEAAPLGDAALTPYHAIKRSLGLLVPGSTAVVIGIGGLGHMAIQILRALAPSQVVAVDVDEERLALARELGADEAVRTEAAEQAVGDLTAGRGADLVLDLVGNDDTLALGARIGRPLGHLTLIGLAMGTLPVTFFTLPYECSLATTYWGSAPELIEVIELARTGAIRAHVERFPLDRVEEAYHRMRNGELRGRAVIVP